MFSLIHLKKPKFYKQVIFIKCTLELLLTLRSGDNYKKELTAHAAIYFYLEM
jgi:hypothetical protein